MINGILNIYKEKGYTSHDVVARMRGILHQKKIGHTGTLDPAAEGVLPVCLGNATRLCSMLEDWDKEYRAVLLLGTETDTEDMTGQVTASSPVETGEEEVRKIMASFVGITPSCSPSRPRTRTSLSLICSLIINSLIVTPPFLLPKSLNSSLR